MFRRDLIKPLKSGRTIWLCTLLCVMSFCGCRAASSTTAVLQNRSGYFPAGVEINGEKWEGEFYVLSGEAYRAMMLN